MSPRKQVVHTPQPAWVQLEAVGSLVWVMNDEHLAALLQHVEVAPIVVYDLETTGLDRYAPGAKIVLATFTLPWNDEGRHPVTYVLPLAHPDSPWSGRWRRIITNMALAIKRGRYTPGDPPSWFTRRVVGQNIKFDVSWIDTHTGVDLEACIAWDTQVGSHLLDETSSTRLKTRAAQVFGVPEWDDFDLSTPNAAMNVPLQALGEYAALDTWFTWRLLEHQLGSLEIDEPDPEDVGMARLGRVARWVAMPTVASLTRIERNGFRLDAGMCESEADRLEAEVATGLEALAEAYATADFPPSSVPSIAPTSRWFMALCMEGVEREELVIDATTPTGRPQWSRYVLARQARTSPLAQTILDLREADKQAQFLRSWLDSTKADGRIRASYHPGRVVTGRLSSSDPNMQQVSRKLKHLFVPSDGYVLADCDYSQVELRVAAEVSGCVPMLEAFQRGDDLHRLVVARILGITPDEVTKDQRQRGKAANFGFLYGMGARKFARYADENYGVIMDADEAQAAYDGFFSLWDGLAQWHQSTVRRCRHDGQVVSPIGRVRRLPGIWDSDMGTVARAEHQAINSPVQGFASDLMQTGAALVQGLHPARPWMHDRLARVVATVHDSIVVEVPEDRWETVAGDVLSTITSGVVDVVAETLEYRLRVPLVAEASIGTRWGWNDVGSLSRSSTDAGFPAPGTATIALQQ
jgi:DNA polymerase-1